MRLKTVSRTLFLGVLLALLANFVFLILIKRADDSATRAAAAREETVLAVEKLRRETEMLRRLVRAYTAPRRFVWKPTATIGGGRSAVWACGQVAERLVHMPMRPCSA